MKTTNLNLNSPRRNRFYQMVAIAMALATPVAQSYAFELQTESMINTALANATVIDNQIDENSQELIGAEIDETQVDAKFQRKFDRWNLVLQHKMPAVEKRIASHYQQMKDADVLNEVKNLTSDNDFNDASKAREYLTQLAQNKVIDSMPRLASAIAHEGGLLKYIVHTKKMRKQAVQNLSKKNTKTLRSPASDQRACWENYLVYSGAALMLIGAIFISVPVVGELLGAGAATLFTGAVIALIRSDEEMGGTPTCHGIFD